MSTIPAHEREQKVIQLRFDEHSFIVTAGIFDNGKISKQYVDITEEFDALTETQKTAFKKMMKRINLKAKNQHNEVNGLVEVEADISETFLVPASEAEPEA
jgi:hypothetical protein